MIRLIITITGHDDDEKEYTFDQNIIKFGRLKGNDVILPGANVSRHHCSITREEGAFLLEDFSSNGTILNEKLLGRGNKLPLRNGDSITLGDFNVQFEVFTPTEEFEKTTDYLQKRFEELMSESAPSAEYPSLLILGGPTSNTRIELMDQMEEILLGRTPDCPIQIPSPTISKHHARIIRRGTLIEIEDLGSSNGTTVNGEAVSGTHPLKDRDEIILGQRGEEEPIRIVFSFPPSARLSSTSFDSQEGLPTVPMSAEEVAVEIERLRVEAQAKKDPSDQPAAAEAAPVIQPEPPALDVQPELQTPSEPVQPETAPVETDSPPRPTIPMEEIKTGWGVLEYVIFGAVGIAVITVIVLLIIFLM